MMVHLPGLATTQDRLLWLLIVLTAAKLFSTMTLVILGDYRAPRLSFFRRFVGATSKTTPPFMCLTAGALEFSLGSSARGYLFFAGSFAIAGFAIYVTSLRRRGKFFGAADWMLRYLGPRQVKVTLLIALLSMLVLIHVSGCGLIPA